MKKLLLILLCLPMIGFGQNTFKYSKSNKYKASGDFNGYKYIKTSNLTYNDGTIDRWKIIENTHNFFQQNGFIILSENDYSELENKCEVLFLDITHTNIIPPNYGTNYVYFKYFNCNKYLGEFSGGAATMTVQNKL